jgi:hypothetical protein
MMLMMMLLSLSAQEDRIALSGGLPQSPRYRTTTELTCEGDGTYVFVVENRGFRLPLLTSTLNGAPVELRSTTGTLQGSMQRLRDVSVEPITCRGGSGAAVRVWGTDSVPSSSTFGERVTFGFQAEINCERRRAVSERDIGCRPEDGQ